MCWTSPDKALRWQNLARAAFSGLPDVELGEAAMSLKPVTSAGAAREKRR